MPPLVAPIAQVRRKSLRQYRRQGLRHPFRHVGTAKLVKLLVVGIRLSTDPDRAHLNGNQVGTLAGEQQEIASVGNRECHLRVAIEYPFVDVFKQFPRRLYDARRQLYNVDFLERKTADGAQRIARSKANDEGPVERLRENNGYEGKANLGADLGAVVSLKLGLAPHHPRCSDSSDRRQPSLDVLFESGEVFLSAVPPTSGNVSRSPHIQ